MQKARKAGRSGILFLLMLFVLTFAIGTSSVEAATVKLNKTSATVYVGKTVTLKVSGTTKTVTWSSSNKKVATVSSKGKVTAVKAGTATIKAKVGGKTYSCKVTVKSPYLSKTSTTLIKGQSTTLTLTGATMKSASSSKKSVATVTSKGKITAKKSGTTTITIKDTKGNKYTCKVTVKVGSLSSSSESLIKGAAKTLTLSSVDIKGVKSNKTSVATVSQTSSRKLKITAKASGTATITVTDKYGNTYKCKVTVKLGTLSASTASINVGSTKNLTVSGVTVKSASSSDKSVATVSVTSSTKVKITAKKAGTATITVTDQYGNTYKCKVTVKNVAVTKVALSKSSLTLDIGGTSTLTATVSPSNATNKSVTWSSSNTSVAKVSSAGKVTAVSAGTATITATAADGSGKKATCKVTVNPQLVTSITLSETAVTLDIGGVSTLTATVSPSNATNKSVTWSSSDTSVATVDSTGKVTAVAAGTATITVTAADGSGKKATCKVTVNPQLVTEITLSETTATLEVGGTTQLTATVSPSNAANKSVTWSSSDTSVATVDSAGEVTAVGAGTATITATAADGSGISASCEVEVTENEQLVTGITLSATTATLEIGGTTQLTATVSPSDATNKNVTWSSSDTSVATVDSTGKVTAAASGAAIITATATDGSDESARCVVIVNAAETGTSKNIIELGVEQDVSLAGDDENMDYVDYYYTPSVSGMYKFSLMGLSADYDFNGEVVLYQNGSYLTYGSWSYDEDNLEEIYIIYNLTAGVEYTFHVYAYDTISGKALLQEFSFALAGVTGDVSIQSLFYNNEEAFLYLYGDTIYMPDFELTFENAEIVEIQKSDTYLSYGGIAEGVQLIDDEGNTYLYYIYYCINPSVFELQSISGDGAMLITDTYYEYRTGYIDIVGTAETLTDSLALSFGEGVTCDIQELEDYYAYVILTYDDLAMCYLHIYYEYDDTAIFGISNVTGTDITSYSAERDSSEGELYIYGLTASMPEFDISVNDGVNYKVSTDDEDYDAVIYMTYDDSTYVYYVCYYYDTSDFVIQEVKGDITNWRSYKGTSSGSLYLYGFSSTIPEFEVEMKDGVTCTITEDDYDNTVLVMTAADGRTYTYYVYYSFDKSLFEIDSVSGSDIYYYSSTESTSGGTLWIYGSAPELSDYTVTLDNSRTEVVLQDSSFLVLVYKNAAYMYTVYYCYIPSCDLSLDEEVGVEITDDVSVAVYTFTPDSDGTYTFYSYNESGDPYCSLYEGSILVRSNDDCDDEDFNFSLTYELEAGVEYTYVVRDYDGTGTCTVKLVSEE